MNFRASLCPIRFAAEVFSTRGVLQVSAAIILGGALALQALTLRNVDRGDRSTQKQAGQLSALLPPQIQGWRSQEEQLGPTEFETAAAQDMLNYDDVFYRAYRQSSRHFSLFVDYWSAGRMPPNRIAEHTPDICWVSAGWQRAKSRSDYVIRTEGIVLKGAQWRVMTTGTTSQQVAFWHLVDGRVYTQGLVFGTVPSPAAFFRGAIRYATGARQEQYFVRLASSVPFEELKDDPGFQEIVRALAKLGLEDRSGPKS